MSNKPNKIASTITLILAVCLLANSLQSTSAQQNSETPPVGKTPDVQQHLIELSKSKWKWMADKNTELLEDLFHEKSVFVHMGGSWGKDRELDIIRSGGIHYKNTEIHEVSVNVIDSTAILLNRITLVAVVGGNEVTNPFEVTEVYVQQNDAWKLASLSFTGQIRR